MGDVTYEQRVRVNGPGPLAGQRLFPSPRIGVTLDERRCGGANEQFGAYAPGGGIAAIKIHGPLDVAGVGATPSWRAIFNSPPPVVGDEVPCVREIPTRLATHADRRPVDPGRERRHQSQ